LEECLDGFCVAGDPPCDPPNGCNLCDEDNHECLFTCAEDADCDNGLFCDGVESCDGCACLPGNPCPGGCDEDLARCFDPCVTNVDCDDGLFCNGLETCVNGSCTDGAEPCGPSPLDCETCLEATDSCASICTSQADCDDSNACTLDACDGCVCINERLCPNACDPATGQCID
jgi:hypothetical protein